MSSDFEIKRLLEITKNDKYAATVAAFEVVDLLDQIQVPKNFSNRKPSIKALQLLSEKSVSYDFISDDQRDELYIELGGDEYENEEQRAASASEVADQIFAPVSSEPESAEEVIDSDSDDEDDDLDDDDDSDDDLDDDDEIDQDDDDDDDDDDD